MSPALRRVAAHVLSVRRARVDPELLGSLKSQGFRRRYEGFCQARAPFAASHPLSRSASKVVLYLQLGGQGSAHLSSPCDRHVSLAHYFLFGLVFFFISWVSKTQPSHCLSGRRAPLFVRKKGRNNSKRTIRKLARIYGNREISRSHEPQIHFQTDKQTKKHFLSTHTVGRILAATVMPAIVNCLYLVSLTGHRKVQDSSSTVSWV